MTARENGKARFTLKTLGFVLFTIVMGLGLTLVSNHLLAEAAPEAQTGSDPTPKPDPVDQTAEEGFDPERQQRLQDADPVILAPLAPTADTYGYVMTSGIDATWYDLLTTSGAKVFTNTLRELDWSRSINLGFEFRFYENKYTQLYVNDNGLISFGAPVTYDANDVIPMDVLPNNYIAGFWDSLDVGYNNNGAIYYHTFGSTPNRVFVAEWYNATRLGGEITKTVTFEIALFETSSDIRILYNAVNIDGSLASIGIEDADGIDGLQFSYHQVSEPVNQRFVLFDRPANAETAPRLRILPTYSGKMVVKRKAAFQVQVRNTSGTQTDRFDLTYPAPPTGWTVSLLAADGRTPLTDTDGSGIKDTGAMAPLTNKTITVLVETNSSVAEGAYFDFNLTGTSRIAPYPSASTRIQAAVPVNLAMAFYDLQGNKKALLDLIWKYDDYSVALLDPFLKGGNPAIARKADKGYVYTWDNRNAPEEQTYREIRFLILNQFGGAASGVFDIDDHASPYELIYDSNPAVAADSNGKIGFTWVREAGVDRVKDIYFAIREANGNPASSIIKVTNNPGSQVNESPTLAATTNHNFIVAWVHKTDTAANGQLWYAVYSSTGTVVRSSAPFTSDPAVDYTDPSLTSLTGARALCTYTSRDAIGVETIKYRVFDAGVMESTEYGLPDAEGWGSRSVQFTDGNVLVAWSTREQTVISYVIITNVKNPGTPSKQNLSAPNNRPVGNVSLVADKGGRCILVWIDYRYLNFIYYAVVLSNGTVRTPAMTYQGEGNTLSLYTSENGLAITTYDGAFRVQVPVVRK
jgi:hypothetical protein